MGLRRTMVSETGSSRVFIPVYRCNKEERGRKGEVSSTKAKRDEAKEETENERSRLELLRRWISWDQILYDLTLLEEAEKRRKLVVAVVAVVAEGEAEVSERRKERVA